VRPEEIGEWQDPIAPAASVTFAASADSQGQAVEHAVEQARRVAARGADAVVIVDSLEYVSPAVARRALAAARNIVDGGSLTVIASAPAALGGETTVIALDAQLVAMGRFPALDLTNSGTMRPELLVGDAGAEAIAKARADTAAGV
jgi:transcription termination factor Rho